MNYLGNFNPVIQNIAKVNWTQPDSKLAAKALNPNYNMNVIKTVQTDGENFLYSPEIISKISSVITRSLKGVHPSGKDIKVSDRTIIGVMKSITQAHIPRAGDIYSKYYTMIYDPRDDGDEIVMRVIETITSQLRDEFEMEKNNRKLNIWDTILGEHNDKGLLAHAPIKLKERRPDPFLISMRY